MPELARAAVRAAVEAELTRDAPRLTLRRTAGRVLVAGSGADPAERQRLLDQVAALGARADELASAEPLLPVADVQAALRRVATTEALAALSPDRLVRLAAAASRAAAASAQLELHPRGMPSDRALRLGRGALLGADELTTAEVQRRIAARFPDAEPLPDRPALDEVLGSADVALEWDERAERWRAPSRAPLVDLTSHASSTRFATRADPLRSAAPSDPAVVEARAFSERLRASADAGGLLVLMTSPRRLVAAGERLRRLPVHAIDVDALVLEQLRLRAEARRVRWDRVLGADAALPGHPDWTKLTTLVREAMQGVEAAITERDGVVLLEHVGLLARYGEVGLIERLRAATQNGAALRGVWVLVPADRQSDRPQIDGTPIPILGPNERVRMPSSWIAARDGSFEQDGRAVVPSTGGRT